MIISMTGATGNFGVAVMKELVKIKEVEKIKVLVRPTSNKLKRLKKALKKDFNKVEVVAGGMGSFDAVLRLAENSDYFINMAGVIPPRADKFPSEALSANDVGAKNVVKACESVNPQPKLIHISSMAVYGNRTYSHPWGKVGDPVLPNPYDMYSTTKMRAEFYVLESDLNNFVILRQNPMLHDKILDDNTADGLMFQTAFNAPLEWVTDGDSGRLLRLIIEKDIKEDLSKVFWNRVFNIGGLPCNRITGYDVMNGGFSILGGSAKDYFKPNFNSVRNFHGMWFTDSSALDDIFHYLSESVDGFWKKLKKKKWYYAFGKVLPKDFLSKTFIQKLFADDLAPRYWADHNDINRLIAFYGSKENYLKIPDKWEDYSLLCEGKIDGKDVDYEDLKDEKNAFTIDYGFDSDKKDDEITLADLQAVATMHGGKLLSADFDGNMYAPLTWETQDGEKFTAKPYTILRGGHWINISYRELVWDFDRLCKKDKIFGQVWYDSHEKNENYYYSFDENFTPKLRKNNV